MKKILSIDGGGIKGVFPIALLAQIEKNLLKENDSIFEYFDIITGTSTGAIIALALGTGMRASEILEFYEKNGSEIFHGNSWINNIKEWITRKYNNKYLKEALEKEFGDKKLGECKTRMVIPVLDKNTMKPYVYKTSHHKRFERDYKVKIVDIAMGSSAAPVTFSEYRTEDNILCIDGGIGANNPTFLGVAEAIGVLEWPIEEIKVLSLGCTEEGASGNNNEKMSLKGKLYYAGKVLDLFMKAQTGYSEGLTRILLRVNEHEERYVRINQQVQKNEYKLDKADEKTINNLKGFAVSKEREYLSKVKLFFEEKAEKFEPIYRVEE
jgi:patatin-like phospholipase/acyl hydrolase